MPVMPEGPLRATRAHHQDRNARDHAYLWVHPDEERQMKMESRRNGSPHATDAAGFLDLVRRH